jgi:ATP-dependent DNA helicase DinG
MTNPVPAPTIPVEGPSNFTFTEEAAAGCAREIREAGGVEVFFIGRRNRDSGLIEEVESHAYGTERAVPALGQLARPGDVLVHNHPSGHLIPSEADISVASAGGQMGIGFYIIDNEARRCRIVVKPQDARKKAKISEGEVVAKLSARGIGRLMQAGEFEDRPQQRTMAAAITRALNNDGIAVVEAGTGTGKSFAYLLPSVLFALRNGERVVVSTNTINLQEQLLHKDIPLLRQSFDEEFEVEIVKGRSNYVCKRKADFARSEQTLFADESTSELRQILKWAETSPTGDRQELPFIPRYENWERVQSEADNCLRVRCPFYEQCFFYNSRRSAARAKVLIVNHSLLLSDLAVRQATGNYTLAAVLPPYKHVILDEAHHLEDVATRNLAEQVSKMGLLQHLGRLMRRETGSRSGGLFSAMNERIEEAVREYRVPANHPAVEKFTHAIHGATAGLRENGETLFNDLLRDFMQLAKIDSVPAREELKIRITPAMRGDTAWRDYMETLNRLAEELMTYLALTQECLAAFEEIVDEKLANELVNPLMEWGAIAGRLDSLRKTVISLVNPPSGFCQWGELFRRQGHGSNSRDVVIRLCSAPIEVRAMLQNALHSKMKSEVLTSATLAVESDFRFFSERIGLPQVKAISAAPQRDEEGLPIIERDGPDEARLVEQHVLPAPFSYGEQVYFGVPSDMPDPRDANYDSQLAELINRSVAVSGGRAFLLFTSYGQLKRVADLCTPTIRRLGITVLKQGEDNRDALLQRFREDETSVLFATSSFWEGVDVKGRALELLVLAKLPFSVPTEPIQEAQFEALKARGIDPFDALVVPRAIIRFKQGFGRLIRAKTDRGAVIVADRRLVQMPYGRRFVRSLPGVQVRQRPTTALMEEMREFFRT